MLNKMKYLKTYEGLNYSKEDRELYDQKYNEIESIKDKYNLKARELKESYVKKIGDCLLYLSDDFGLKKVVTTKDLFIYELTYKSGDDFENLISCLENSIDRLKVELDANATLRTNMFQTINGRSQRTNTVFSGDKTYLTIEEFKSYFSSRNTKLDIGSYYEIELDIR